MFIKINTAFVCHADWHTQFLASTREKYSISSGKMFVARRLQAGGHRSVKQHISTEQMMRSFVFFYHRIDNTSVSRAHPPLGAHFINEPVFSLCVCLWWRLCAVCSVVVMDVHTKRDGKRICVHSKTRHENTQISAMSGRTLSSIFCLDIHTSSALITISPEARK